LSKQQKADPESQSQKVNVRFQNGREAEEDIRYGNATERQRPRKAGANWPVWLMARTSHIDSTEGKEKRGSCWARETLATQGCWWR